MLDQNKGAHYLMIDFVSEVDYEKMISPIGKLYTASIDTSQHLLPAQEENWPHYFIILFFFSWKSSVYFPTFQRKKMGRSSQMMYSTFPPGTSEMGLLL